jgi:hypothetical protein
MTNGPTANGLYNANMQAAGDLLEKIRGLQSQQIDPEVLAQVNRANAQAYLALVQAAMTILSAVKTQSRGR